VGGQSGKENGKEIKNGYAYKSDYNTICYSPGDSFQSTGYGHESSMVYYSK